MKILSWNIRGIFGKVEEQYSNKLKIKHVENLLQKYDVIFLQETHLEQKKIADVYVTGFKSIHYCRPKRKKASSASGGISVFMKEEYREKVKLLPQNNPDVVWMHIFGKKK